MIGLVLVTHGELAADLMKVCTGIVGECKQVAAICFAPGEARHQLCEKVEQAIRSVEKGNGVLILVDSFGGSPSTICLGMIANYQIEIISGVNLAMILEALYHRDKSPLQELAQRVEEAGKKGIVNASELYRAKLKLQTK